MDDTLILWLVVGARFLVPLTIPRYPLPGVIAALILDAVDQTIFQTFTTLPLDNYQNYDKALDIYYLTIAYIATIRNWSNEAAFRLGRFLFYYRLVGALLFELTGARSVLLFFPNVFEYFFIFVEVVRLRWDPLRLSAAALLAWAGAIWVFIKVPQEYWIHVAQRDVTDTIGELLAAPPGPAGDLMAWWPVWGLGLAAAVAVGLVWLARRLPAPDHGWSVAADSGARPFSPQLLEHARVVWARDILDRDLLEKTLLITLISLIFAQVLPGPTTGPWLLSLGIVVLVVVNTVASHWLSRRGGHVTNTVREFLVMLFLNGGLIVIYGFIGYLISGEVAPLNGLFFTVLLTLLITLYDRYQHNHLARFPAAWAGRAN